MDTGNVITAINEKRKKAFINVNNGMTLQGSLEVGARQESRGAQREGLRSKVALHSR